MQTAKACAKQIHRLDKNIKTAVSICILPTLIVCIEKLICLKTEPKKFTNGVVMLQKLSPSW